ncbi:MAG: hypothetical protein Q7V05_13020 [Methanoregula sp.]|nr:hypothetical protein [Methanoregula sp.]
MSVVPENAGLPFDFVIFSGFCTCFVKVRRTRSNLSELQDILQLCNADIRDIRTMPELCGISTGTLGARTSRDVAVLPDHGRCGHGDPERWLGHARHINEFAGSASRTPGGVCHSGSR